MHTHAHTHGDTNFCPIPTEATEDRSEHPIIARKHRLQKNSNPSNPLSFEHGIEHIRSGGCESPFSWDHSKEADAVVAEPSNQFVNQCPICYRKFKAAYIFKRHVARRNCSTIFPCKQCGNGFKSQATLIQHLKAIHSDDRPLKCSECDKTFSRASSLSQHRKTHSPDKDFVCVICGAAFHQKGNLKTHLKKHSGEKPFVCSYCNQAFSKMSNMMQHRKVMHEPEAKPAGYRCGICNGLFSRPYLLKSHQQKIHGVVREETPRKPEPPPATLPVPCITTVVIPAIQTSAMAVAKARGEIPFAVLHMMNEIPLIVRVVEQGKYSVLKAAESNDFRESQRGGPGLEEPKSVSIAVVATIHQKINEEGKHFFEISGPVSCYQTNQIPQEDRTAGALQDSIANMNLHKTLTQLNATEVSTNIKMLQKDLRLPAIRPHEVDGPVPSTSGINKLKRKPAAKQQSNAAPGPIKRAALKQPKVVTTVIDNSVEWTHSTRPVMPQLYERNFQNIATGSLLSPERAKQPLAADDVIAIEQEDPFRDINVFDLIQTGNELLSTTDGHLQDIDIDGSMEEIFVPVL